MPTLEVKCTVSNCIFHDEKNICGADKIEINMDYQTIIKERSEFASEFDVKSGKAKASDSTQTCCNTFKPKNI